MTTNTLVSIAMAPFEPLEDREWAVIGGYLQKYRFTLPVSRSNTQSEVAGPTITSYAAIPPRPTLESLPYDRSEPKRTPRVYLDHNRDRSDADDGTGPIAATGIRRHDGSSGIGRHHSIWPHLLVTRICGNSKPIICFRLYGR